MKIRLLTVMLCAIMFGACFATTSTGVVQDKKASLDRKIVELKSKRRDTLKRRLDAVQGQWKMGEIEMDKVITARDDLYGAELELATTKEVRVKLRQQRFENMISLQRLMKERFDNGIGSLDDYLLASASRLQAEIDYLRAQAAE